MPPTSVIVGFGQVNSHHPLNSQLKEVAKSPQDVCENTFTLSGLNPGMSGLSEVVNPARRNEDAHRDCYQATLKWNQRFKTSTALSNHTNLRDAGRVKGQQSLEKAEEDEIIVQVRQSSRVVLEGYF